MPRSGSGPRVSPAFDDAAPNLKRSRSAAFLADPTVPEPLKQTYRALVDEARVDLIAALIDTGDLDAHMQCAAHPMGGFLAQLATLSREKLQPHLTQILAALNARDIPLADLVVPTYYNGSTDTSRLDGFAEQTVSQRPLVQWLMEKFSLKALDIADRAPQLLAQNYRSGDVTQPLVHHYILNASRQVTELEDLAQAAGTLDFLDVVDAAGKTVFFRLATQGPFDNALDIMSWMLLRRPELIQGTDALGWTVLDRYVQRTTNESAHSRFLIAAGARFRWQTPPGLSHAEAVVFRDKHDRINKGPRKDPPPPNV